MIHRKGFRPALVALAVLIAFSTATHAQEQTTAPLVVSLGNGGFVLFTLRTTRPGDGTEAIDYRLDKLHVVPRVLVGDDSVVHRLLTDANGTYVFGYDLRIVPRPTTRDFAVNINPLDREFERQLRAREPDSAQLSTSPLPSLPRALPTQFIKDGEALAIDLLVNNQTQTKIIDVVKVSFDDLRLRLAAALAPVPFAQSLARDFTLADVQLSMRSHELFINDDLASQGDGDATHQGSLLWFHIPGRGRFILSLAPHLGYDFRRAGTITNNKLSFEWNGDRYEWVSRSPIVRNSNQETQWNLWVLHEREFEPLFSAAPENRDERRARAAQRNRLNVRLRTFEELTRGTSHHTPRSLATPAKQDERPPAQVRLTVGAADNIKKVLSRE